MPARINFSARSNASHYSYATRPLALCTGASITATPAFTVEGWFYVNNKAVGTADYLWAECDGSTFGVSLQHYNGGVYWNIKNAAGTNFAFNTASTAVSHRRWVHIAVTRDPATNTNIVYVDGASVSWSVTATPTGTSRTGTKWTTGSADGITAATEPFVGCVRDLRVYSRVLTAQEISTLYSAGTVPSGSVVTYSYATGGDGVLTAGGTSTATVGGTPDITHFTDWIAATSSLPLLNLAWSHLYTPHSLIGDSPASMTQWDDDQIGSQSVTLAVGTLPYVGTLPRRICIDEPNNHGAATETSAPTVGPSFDRRNFTIAAVAIFHGRQSSTGGRVYPLVQCGIDGTTGIVLGANQSATVYAKDGATLNDSTGMVPPSSPHFLALTSNGTNTTIYIDGQSENITNMAAGLCGNASATDNVLYMLCDNPGSRGTWSLCALAVRSRSSTAAELIEIRKQLMRLAGVSSASPSETLITIGDSRGCINTTLGNNYAFLASQYCPNVRTFNLCFPGRTLSDVQAAITELGKTTVAGSPNKTVVLVGAGNEAWTAAGTDNARQTAGQAGWTTSASILSTARSTYGAQKIGAVTCIPRAESGTAANNVNRHGCTWYYNQAARAALAAGTINLLADVADQQRLLPAGTSRTNLGSAATAPTSSNAQIQAITGGALYIGGGFPNIHMDADGFNYAQAEWFRSLTVASIGMNVTRRRRLTAIFR